MSTEGFFRVGPPGITHTVSVMQYAKSASYKTSLFTVISRLDSRAPLLPVYHASCVLIRARNLFPLGIPQRGKYVHAHLRGARTRLDSYRHIC